jgi:hypothetical protein
MTINVTVVVADVPPPVPVTVITYVAGVVPDGTCTAVCTVPGVDGFGVNVTGPGAPLADNVTGALKPPDGTIVTM